MIWFLVLTLFAIIDWYLAGENMKRGNYGLAKFQYFVSGWCAFAALTHAF